MLGDQNQLIPEAPEMKSVMSSCLFYSNLINTKIEFMQDVQGEGGFKILYKRYFKLGFADPAIEVIVEDGEITSHEELLDLLNGDWARYNVLEECLLVYFSGDNGDSDLGPFGDIFPIGVSAFAIGDE